MDCKPDVEINIPFEPTPDLHRASGKGEEMNRIASTTIEIDTMNGRPVPGWIPQNIDAIVLGSSIDCHRLFS
jgi:hypothetical protein